MARQRRHGLDGNAGLRGGRVHADAATMAAEFCRGRARRIGCVAATFEIARNARLERDVDAPIPQTCADIPALLNGAQQRLAGRDGGKRDPALQRSQQSRVLRPRHAQDSGFGARLRAQQHDLDGLGCDRQIAVTRS